MMPVLFWLGDTAVGAWPVFLALASIAAFFVFVFLIAAPQKRMRAPNVTWTGFEPELFFASVYCCGLVGARLVGVWAGTLSEVEHVHTLATQAISTPDPGFIALFMSLNGPMSYFGGVVGGILGSLPFFWGRHINRLPALVDSAVPALIMGLGVGRLGCLFNGDDFGLVVQPSDTMLFASLMPTMHSAGPGDALRYATQLQESLFSIALSLALILFLYLMHIKPISKTAGLMALLGKMHPGQIGAFAGAASCLNRAWNEGFREGVRTDFFGLLLSPWHFVSLALAGALVLCGIWFGRISRDPMTYRASQP